MNRKSEEILNNLERDQKIEVIWVDASELSHAYESDLSKANLVTMNEVGYFIKKDKEQIVYASTWRVNCDGIKKYYIISSVPINCIEDIRLLESKKFGTGYAEDWKPKYSLKDLEKLHYYLAVEHPYAIVKYSEFHELLKNSKKVKEILEGE